MTERRLLVVEDNSETANLLCCIAREVGFKAHTAIGAKAIKIAYNAVYPDIIILDIFMPDMDGIEVLQYLHQQSSKSRIVIISCGDASTRKRTENLGRGLGFSVDANIAKPFQIDEVRITLKNIKIFLDNKRRIA